MSGQRDHQQRSIAREYAVIRKHESEAAAIAWTAAKLGVSEQQVIDIVFESKAA